MSSENFLDAIREATGGAPRHSDIVPGKMVRFATSDRKNDKAGWCKLFDDGTGGVFGCWRAGISETWQAASDRDPDEQAAFLVRVKQAKEEAAKLELEIRKRCREKSAYLWKKGRDADAKHPYLAAKAVMPHGIRQLKNALLVPVRDTTGTMHGLQFIMPDGSKRFKAGTVITACYHAIGQAKDRILIAEGYATGATLHELTGHATACSFTAGNLKPVAEALRQKYPDMLLIVCADDDHATERNPGLTKATEAALAVSGLLAVPCFPATRTAKDTDFNDLARLAGPEAVMTCIEDATAPAPPTPAGNAFPDYPLEAVIERLSKLTPPCTTTRCAGRKQGRSASGPRPWTPPSGMPARVPLPMTFPLPRWSLGRIR